MVLGTHIIICIILPLTAYLSYFEARIATARFFLIMLNNLVFFFEIDVYKVAIQIVKLSAHAFLRIYCADLFLYIF